MHVVKHFTNTFTFEQNNCGANLITNIYFRICPEVQSEDEDKFIKYFRISKSDKFATDNELEWSDWMVFENKDSINSLNYICNTNYIRIEFKAEYVSQIPYEICDVIIKFDKKEVCNTQSANIFTETLAEQVADYTDNLTNLVSDTMSDYYTQNVLYIKANTNIKNSSDPFLLEWNLLQYENPKVVKILFNDDEEIDTEWVVNPFGMNFQSPLEISIQIKHFQSIFGNASRPQAHDMIYIKKLNRMYEVISSDITRGANYQPMYFKLSINQAEKRNYIETEPIQEFYDNVLEPNMLSIEKLFGETNKKEEVSITDDMQLKTKNRKNKEVYRRNNTVYKQEIDKDYSYKNIIVSQEIFNNGVKISRTHYDFSKVTEGIDILRYTVNKYISDNFTYSCWFNIRENEFENLEVTKYSIIDDKLFLTVKPFNIKNIKTYLGMYNNTDIEYFKIDSYNRTKREFQVTVTDVEKVSNMLQTDLKFMTFNRINFLKSDKLSVWYIPNNGFVIDLNDVTYIYKDVEKDLKFGKWLALVVSFAPTLTNTLKVKLYDPVENSLKDYSIELEQSQYCNYENEIGDIDSYSIEASQNLKITNIKLINKNVGDSDLLNRVINAYIATDSENYIILDNCNLPIEDSYIGNPL